MKIDHILFPIDFSDHNQALKADVEWLAAHFGARVTLLNVFEVPTFGYGAGEAPILSGDAFTDWAETEKKRIEEYAIDVAKDQLERVSREGSAGSTISQWAKDHQVDLIVMGTHGRGNFHRLLLGSVAMKVLHEVTCPVWTHSVLTTTATIGERNISSIVCSVELTDEIVPLLRFTQDLANEFCARVMLVHSVPETDSRPEKYLDSDLHRFLKNRDAEEIANLQIKAGTNFPVCLTETSIAQDIAAVASVEQADVVIIGRGVIQETFGTWRTHTSEIIRYAPCPVLSYAVKAQKPALKPVDGPALIEQPVG